MTTWLPTASDPLLILAADHRESYEKLFPPSHGDRTPELGKQLIYRGLRQARDAVTAGRSGILVDQQFGVAVIAAAVDDGVELAVPLEKSGQDWFETLAGDDWLANFRSTGASFAKVLVRDNPDFDDADRQGQFTRLAAVSSGLRDAGIPLIFELLVPATEAQKAGVDGDDARYDAEVRAGLVATVITQNLDHGVRPELWKVEGLESEGDARRVVAADADARFIVLGRDAPPDRLEHWLEVAHAVDGFVGFAIGRSIWEDAIVAWATGRTDDDAAVAAIAGNYRRYASDWLAAGPVSAGTPGTR